MEESKKSERKRKRFAARLLSSKAITCTETPKPGVVLCNAGQATGLNKNTINNLIEVYLPDVAKPKYIALKGETHSFIEFLNTEDATLFYNACNGKARIEEKGPPLYMSFVETVATNETICKQDNPNGLTILNDFITCEEERLLINLFDWTEVNDNNLKNRQVKHYGYEFQYSSNDVDLSSPLPDKIPDECKVLWERLKEYGIDDPPNQLTVNKYSPGQGIPSHVDKHSPFGNTILSLSLGSSIVMDWRRSKEYVPIVVQRRSMMIMSGEARYDWQHGIKPRTYDPVIEERTNDKVITGDTVPRQTRISLTFRWTRCGPCECSFKTLCDSMQRESDEITDDIASNLEELHVHQVYEVIASHFSSTRHRAWPRVTQFMSDVPPGSIALDLGAGNGKNVLHRTDLLQIAGERSGGLLAECKQHIEGIPAADCLRLDLLYAPLKDSCADAVICIAVIHHFSSKARRLQAVRTISRVLRVGGRALITVWAKDQTKSNYLKNKEQHEQNDEANSEIVTVSGINLPVHENRTQFKHTDLLVPWKLRVKGNLKESSSESTLLRYYHVFEESELNALCEEVKDLEVEDSFYEEGNWCVICKKTVV